MRIHIKVVVAEVAVEGGLKSETASWRCQRWVVFNMISSRPFWQRGMGSGSRDPGIRDRWPACHRKCKWIWQIIRFQCLILILISIPIPRWQTQEATLESCQRKGLCDRHKKRGKSCRKTSGIMYFCLIWSLIAQLAMRTRFKIIIWIIKKKGKEAKNG